MPKGLTNVIPINMRVGGGVILHHGENNKNQIKSNISNRIPIFSTCVWLSELTLALAFDSHWLRY
jgi:hypothetical protein